MQAETWLASGLLTGLWALRRTRLRLALCAYLVTLTLVAAISLLPVGEALMALLEAVWPPRAARLRVDGIVVLGRFEEFHATRKWGPLRVNAAVERLIATAALACQHSETRIVL